ncbi:MAG: RNase adapter RapZ [Oscillospiraceae bacterium]|nr:RNase adapter RapZ [Oscillospiraceae bacterium]
MEILILTGMSGAGKTHAVKVFEDLGCYCVDNMPAVMLSEFVNIYRRVPDKNQTVVFVIDVRGESEFNTLIRQLDLIRIDNSCRLIFLDCTEEELIIRYKEKRKRHPLTLLRGLDIRAAITAERELLSEAKLKSDFVIDTTKTTLNELKNRLTDIFEISAKRAVMTVNCISFGFKYGIPTEADLVFDVRCFPNPFYIEGMRQKTGLDTEVANYVLSHDQTLGFIEKLKDMINYMLPLYTGEGRANLVVAIGCTGGKHRSVCISEVLKKYLLENNKNAVSFHRDIHKE